MAVREWCGGEQFDPGFVDLDQINEDLLEREALVLAQTRYMSYCKAR
tara:strand:+ start:691 stop:831 length:141 start_codon:yes stop_codon:yes gene_type:complete